MWSVDVQQQLNVGSGFWGLVLNLTLWSCSRQRGLNASLQLLHTSCSPNVFHSSQTQAGAHTDAHSKTRAAALRTETPRTVDHFQRKQGPLYPDHSIEQHGAFWDQPLLLPRPTLLWGRGQLFPFSPAWGVWTTWLPGQELHDGLVWESFRRSWSWSWSWGHRNRGQSFSIQPVTSLWASLSGPVLAVGL